MQISYSRFAGELRTTELTVGKYGLGSFESRAAHEFTHVLQEVAQPGIIKSAEGATWFQQNLFNLYPLRSFYAAELQSHVAQGSTLPQAWAGISAFGQKSKAAFLLGAGGIGYGISFTDTKEKLGKTIYEIYCSIYGDTDE